MTELYFTGAIVEPRQKSDFKYKDLVGYAPQPFDWETGFELPEIEAKDQNQSSSCGGFACSYFMETLFGQIKSPKFIYSLAKDIRYRGTSKIGLCSTLKNIGSCDETVCPSFKDGVCTEEFVSNREDITQEMKDLASKSKILVYSNVNFDFESIAQALRDNKGVIIGLTGTNNGTWRTEYPMSTNGAELQYCWRHWLFVTGARLINGKKHIKVLNSWGNVGNKGYQWLNEAHTKDIWEAFTFTKASDYVFTQTLRLGMRNTHVGMLQKKLKELGYFNHSVTSLFGTITLSAVRKFQKDNGLFADGIVGKKTNFALNIK